MVNTTSSAVTGSPSCQTRVVAQLERSRSCRSASTDQRSARSGHDVPAGPLRTSPSIDERNEVAIGLGAGGQRR